MNWINRTILSAAVAAVFPVISFAENPRQVVTPNGGDAAVIVQAGPTDLVAVDDVTVNPAKPGEHAPDAIIQANGQAFPLPPGAPPMANFRGRVGPLEKGAYLGISATPAPAVIGKQLDLPEGMGLVVDVVMPDSPAGVAGLKQYDVLQKLDDQLLINSEQLAVLVRSHKAGEEIKLTIIRQGKPMVVTAKLVEHELEPLGDIEFMQRQLPEEMRRLLPEPSVRSILPMPGNGPMQFKMLMREPGGGTASYTLIDGDHSYSINTDQAGHKTFIVKDKDGKSLFDGLIDTPEQRAKLPDDLKAKLDHMEQLTPKADKDADAKPEEKK